MLKLLNITKEYPLKDAESVKALKGLSVSFRPNEFVAILGHSGCGKTTLLNIIGGLDKYTSGDLIIKGKSTKEYSDHDWDTYRNHSVGFVFQAYNLIPHQNILGNVELSLTIGGIKKKDRRKRALEALKKVGLEGMEKKRPNQLSGGQMQRVAIARALVNNPEILLADEPTGALDSETSVQIMDLLKEVAKDKLVIMVTHNPDLAYTYANRIVKMSDGLIIDDSNPFTGLNEDELKRYKEIDKVKNAKDSSMSFRTAFGLSMSNLLNKLKRTLLVVLAGSIGIIGVSAVLSVSHGVKGYIASMQNDMLSAYPIEITEESVDYSSLMSGLDTWDKKKLEEFDPEKQVGIDSMINYLMSAYKGLTSIKTNIINQDLVSYIDAIPKEDVAIISKNYGIDVTNNIFTKWDSGKKDEYISLNGLTQSYISELKTVEGFSSYASYVDLFTNFMQELPNNPEYILSQYDLLGSSTLATKEDEIMLVVDGNSTLTDLIFAQMGILGHDSFLNLAQRAIKANDKDNTISREELEELYPYPSVFNYEDLIGKEFYYLPHDDIYSYGDISSKTYDEISVVLEKDGKIYTLTYDSESDTLSGVYLETSPFTYSIVYLQRQGEKKDVEGKKIVDGAWAGIVGDMNHFMVLNLNQESQYASNMIWLTDDIASFDPTKAVPEMYTLNVNSNTKSDYVYGYQYSAVQSEDVINSKAMKMKIVGILRAKPTTNFGSIKRGVFYTEAFATRYINDSLTSDIINNEGLGFKQYIGSEQEKSKSFNAYVTFDYLDYSINPDGELKHGYASSLNSDASSSFSNLFSNLTGVNYFENDQKYLRSLCGLKATIEDDGSTSFDLVPQEIKIYPIDFDSKDSITSYLDKWNSDNDVKVNGTSIPASVRPELSYTDTIQIIVYTINTLIDTITIALVAFTSLSLVVSCFMIAVITYISVMERVKEIGVIRSLGGRKKDVSRLFIAENLITGLFSGVFGIIITFVLCVILNAIIKKYNVSNIGDLTVGISVIMISLSIFLSVGSGLIPSMKASHQDPVTALRSE